MPPTSSLFVVESLVVVLVGLQSRVMGRGSRVRSGGGEERGGLGWKGSMVVGDGWSLVV